MVVAVLVTLCAIGAGRTTQVDDIKEYTLTVGGEVLRFAARPEWKFGLSCPEGRRDGVK